MLIGGIEKFSNSPRVRIDQILYLSVYFINLTLR